MAPINWNGKQSWDFEPIDENRFPAVQLARRAGALGSSVAAIYNAANEVAVAAFMKEEIAFTAIVDTIEKVVDKLSASAPSRIRDISDVSAIEQDARIYAREVLEKG
jgi:1-deoxy-D-xylulose-5-phosphate reductoisomerase